MKTKEHKSLKEKEQCICGHSIQDHLKGNGYDSKGNKLISICAFCDCYKFKKITICEE